MTLALKSFHGLLNLDLTVSTRYPNGDKPQVQPASLGLNTAIFNAANVNLVAIPQGSVVTYNYRQYLTGTSAATATLVVNAISGALGNWQIDSTGNGPTNTTALAGTGSLQVVASDNAGHTVSFPIQQWSILSKTQQRKKKWNPGHFMGSNSVIRTGNTASSIYFETNNLNNLDLILGHRAFMSWGSLEQTQGVYTFTELDNLRNRLKTAYNKPKLLRLAVLPGEFGSTNPGDTDYSALPQYIMQGSAYGAAGHATWNFSVNPATVVITNAGSHGWWGGNGNGNTYAACLHRPAVMARWIALHQAIAAHVDGDPLFDGIWFQENSWWIGSSSANRCPDYSNSAVDTQQRALISAVASAFQQTNIQYQNTWAGDITLTQKFEAFMVQSGVLPGSADTTGAAKIAASPTHSFGSWGMDAYQGVSMSGSGYSGPDLRPTIPSVMDVEGPDIGSNGFGTRFTNGRADALLALNTYYKAASAAWCFLLANSAPPTQSIWTGTDGLANFLNNPANALLNTAYPVNAPGYT